jgi:transcriptional regulator with XRE-family HTH domain
MEGETDMETRYLFGKRLRKLRKEHKLTQQELGLMIGITGRAIGQYETGVRSPDNIDIVVKIADFFKVTSDYLLGRTDNPKVEIIQTNFLDDKGEKHTLEIENEINAKEDKISLKELDVLIQLLKKLGLDPNKINLSTF